jgi:hypothetical protein
MMHPERDYRKTGDPVDKVIDYPSATIANLRQQLRDAGGALRDQGEALANVTAEHSALAERLRRVEKERDAAIAAVNIAGPALERISTSGEQNGGYLAGIALVALTDIANEAKAFRALAAPPAAPASCPNPMDPERSMTDA